MFRSLLFASRTSGKNLKLSSVYYNNLCWKQQQERRCRVPKPTENDKKTKVTKDVTKGKIRIGNIEQEVDIETVTTPNNDGGYDTVVKLPFCPISAVKR